jgi:hypothetical protein
VARLPLIDPVVTIGDIHASFDRMPMELNVSRVTAYAEARINPAMRLGGSMLPRHDVG